jgi:hypothetical protein
MESFRILRACGREADQWRELYGRLPQSQQDLHYLPDYGAIYQRTYGHTACLAVHGDEEFVAMPFLLRDVRELNLGDPDMSAALDVTSPYGYGGPVSRLQAARAADGHALFFARFHEYCRDSGVVSEFGSFHPLLQNHPPLGSSLATRLGVTKRKEVVYIDLRQDEESMWGEVSRGHRSSINRSRRLGITVTRERATPERLSVFQAIYDSTMERNQADARWRFPPAYFANCVECLGPDRTSLFIASIDGAAVAQYLILHEGDGVYYHFGGSSAEHFGLRANNLLMYEIALWAKRAGYAWLHLGGGHGAGGGLLQFKAGFSSRRADLYTYSVVHDPQAYDRLCAARRAAPDRPPVDSAADFFPAYRR